MWSGNLEHLITTCPQRLKVVVKGITKPLAPPYQGLAAKRPASVERVYVMSKKEAATSGMVVTGTLFSNSKPFCILFSSSATYSFIST